MKSDTNLNNINTMTKPNIIDLCLTNIQKFQNFTSSDNCFLSGKVLHWNLKIFVMFCFYFTSKTKIFFVCLRLWCLLSIFLFFFFLSNRWYRFCVIFLFLLSKKWKKILSSEIIIIKKTNSKEEFIGSIVIVNINDKVTFDNKRRCFTNN